MKIAIVSTCAAAVPPRAYGGIELFVAVLARALIKQGHALTVYATGDSRPAGRLRARFATPFWPPDYAREREHCAFAWDDIRREVTDVVHLNLPDGVLEAPPHAHAVVTLHHPYDARLEAMYARRPDIAPVAVSNDQAATFAKLRDVRVIQHGLEPEAYAFGRGDGGYVAFLGRIGPEKAPHLAIDAAGRAGRPLIVAGPHWSGRTYYDEYFAREMMPRLCERGGGVMWLGELDHSAKVELLRHAEALLMPSGWREPFGLVMIEAMLAGTPVIAFANGSAPEIVDEGTTGMLVRDVDAMAAAIPRAAAFDRARCRAAAVVRFSAARMAREYLDLYADVATRGDNAVREPRRVAVAK